MAELHCGEFVRIGTDVNTGHPRWRAQLSPHPITPAWQDLLHAAGNAARQRGVYLGEGGTELHCPTGGFIFHAPEGTEAAIAEAMRDIVIQANARMAECEARDAEYGRARAASTGADSLTNMQRWVEHLSTMPPRVLYHYTTQSGLLGITRGKSLWTTSIHRLADSSESSGAREFAQAQIAQSRPADMPRVSTDDHAIPTLEGA